MKKKVRKRERERKRGVEEKNGNPSDQERNKDRRFLILPRKQT